MKPNLSLLVSHFAGLKVLVLGEAMLDSYLEGTTKRFCQEAPVPIITVGERRDIPGGAANTAVNVRELGAHAVFLSVIGQDQEGGLLRKALAERGLPVAHVYAAPHRRTLTKYRVFASGQMLLRIDQGTTTAVGPDSEAALLKRLCMLYPESDAVIVSDYGYGIFTPRVVRALADLQVRWPRVIVVDSRTLERFREVGVTCAKPNYAEASHLLGAGTLDNFRVRAEGIAQHGDRLLELTGARIVAVTLDRDGAVVVERGQRPYRSYASASRDGCVVGAGDTYLSAFSLALATGASTSAAAELAHAAAAIVIRKDRTATCSANELRDYLTGEGKYVADRGRLANLVESYKRQGRKVVFTNGCFDILHRGHISFLNRAKTLGDVLVVGVNSDEGIRRLKGASRPINNLEDRLQVLAALDCVHHLIPFDEDTACNLILVVKPDVFVKGGDYTRERLPEARLVEQFGGCVQILPYLPDRSTTGIIERIQGAYTRCEDAASEADLGGK
jgi:D-beta-D-heptose 7-phosphate kinase/D-beta-D-heptose 1-phosphate adenosyltransferase